MSKDHSDTISTSREKCIDGTCRNVTITRCIPNFDENLTALTTFSAIRIIGGFLIPFVVLIVANSLLITIVLQLKSEVSAQSVVAKRKAILVCLLIVAVFFVTWCPNQVTYTLITIPVIYNFIVPEENMIGLPSIIPFMHIISTCFLIFGSCINPFLYALYGRKIKRAVIVVLAKIGFRSRIQRDVKVLVLQKEEAISKGNSNFALVKSQSSASV
ncbi:Oidioi.mRNA.OKI2018_I69.chr2.g4088.t1.cds [Oikopleura dioica]|uniref:Oidioi.mRNA.OKI2018_I69.chr2.g4088.t1.cds n=1 Tax=Oikopleura dioica TaxID=34765 RepID=A0ABN7SZQ2_OIKDI|nr:Oidioi.mRNA.OKI2018_I69.chr2.g4088.t1.cds [Oikopleura dioica]